MKCADLLNIVLCAFCCIVVFAAWSVWKHRLGVSFARRLPVLPYHILSVLFRRAWKYVRRVATGWIVSLMTRQQSVRYLAMCLLIRKPMRRKLLPVHSKRAISVSRSCSNPRPARVWSAAFVYLLPEVIRGVFWSAHKGKTPTPLEAKSAQLGGNQQGRRESRCSLFFAATLKPIWTLPGFPITVNT